MAKVLGGLSQVGAWGCFIEFNRIPVKVLSVVATQVQTVLSTVKRLEDPKGASVVIEIVHLNSQGGAIYGQ